MYSSNAYTTHTAAVNIGFQLCYIEPLLLEGEKMGWMYSTALVMFEFFLDLMTPLPHILYNTLWMGLLLGFKWVCQ